MEPMVEGGSSVGHEEEGIIGEEKHQKEASVNQSAVGHGAQQSCCWPGMGPGERRVNKEGKKVWSSSGGGWSGAASGRSPGCWCRESGKGIGGG